MENQDEILILTDKYVLFRDICDLPQDRFIELDLGCGKGGFTAAMAAAFPDRIILAADIMLGRMRKVQKKVRQAGADNVRFLRTEARFLMAMCLPDQCLDRVHILCPDPWPKDRHRGHRLMSSDFFMPLNRVLKKGGILHFATDDPEYMETVIHLTETSGLFERVSNEAIADVSGPEFRTEFEKDWIAMGKTVPHVAWRALKPEFTGMH